MLLHGRVVVHSCHVSPSVNIGDSQSGVNLVFLVEGKPHYLFLMNVILISAAGAVAPPVGAVLSAYAPCSVVANFSRMCCQSLYHGSHPRLLSGSPLQTETVVHCSMERKAVCGLRRFRQTQSSVQFLCLLFLCTSHVMPY